MRSPGASIGAGLLAVLAAATTVAVFAIYTPTVVMVIVPGLALISLAAVALWFTGRQRRRALRVAAASSTVIAMLSLPPLLIIGLPIEERVFHLLLILLTITAIVLARSELVASHSGPSPARAS